MPGLLRLCVKCRLARAVCAFKIVAAADRSRDLVGVLLVLGDAAGLNVVDGSGSLGGTFVIVAFSESDGSERGRSDKGCGDSGSDLGHGGSPFRVTRGFQFATWPAEIVSVS